MTGRTHVAIAVTVAVAAGALGAPASASFVLASAAGALVPDLDNTESTLAAKAPILKLVHHIPGFRSHRGFTHSLAFALVVYFAVRLLTPEAGHLLALAASAGTFSHALSLMGRLMGGGVAPGLLLGLVSHDLADLANMRGVELLWPLPQRFRIGLFENTSVVERLVRYGVLAALVWWRWPLGIAAAVATEGVWLAL